MTWFKKGDWVRHVLTGVEGIVVRDQSGAAGVEGVFVLFDNRNIPTLCRPVMLERVNK